MSNALQIIAFSAVLALCACAEAIADFVCNIIR